LSYAPETYIIAQSAGNPAGHSQTLCYNRPGSQFWPVLGAGFKPVERY